MVIDYGWRKDNTQPALVIDLGLGAGRTQCAECLGSGEWAHFHPEPHLFPDGLDCVQCKGQGWVLVSI